MLFNYKFRPLIWSLANNGMQIFLGLGGLLIIIAIWSFVLVQIERDKRDYISNANLHLQNVARGFKDHSQSTILSADQALRVLKFHYEKNGKADFDLLNSYFKKNVIDTNFLNQAGIVSEDGLYIYSNLPNHKIVNISDREHFIIHKEGYGYPLFVSKVVFGRASHKWSIQLSRKLVNPNGGFNGVAVASIDPTYFLNFYRKINLQSNGFSSLLDLNGYVRTLRAGNFSTIEGLKEPLSLPPSVHTEASGVFIANNLYDQVNRIYAFERLSNQPLLVLVGMDLDEVLIEHYVHRNIYLMFAIGLSFMLALFAISAVYTIQRSSRMNRNLLQRTQEAGTANKHKSEFLSAMSHELRTPLNGIMGYAEYIFHSAKDSATRFPAQIIYENSHYLLNLINSLLDLTKVESGQMSLMPTQFILLQEIEEVIKIHKGRIQSRHIQLKLEFRCEQIMQVNIDLFRFKQILNNLLDNAIKYSKDYGEITIEVDEIITSNEIKFAVRDNGIGIPIEMHSEVFQKFWQNEDFVTRKYPGSGLGLAICKRLVELMDGQIGFSSKPEFGSTFYFILPKGIISETIPNE